MKYYNLISLKLPKGLIKKHPCGCYLARHASTGLGLWNEDTTNEIRLEIEKYWINKVSQKSTKASTKKAGEKFYVLSMFPYPSGSLHMGHVRVYAISDAVARFYRMMGKDVIHPMGWDSFGLPAENAARERKVDPEEWTKKNISNMKQQLERMGCLFDWDREVATCDPSYYRWTQELFLMLYKRGLIYRKEEYVNWDPIDCTVLADEQVDDQNRSWRSGAVVEKRLLKQWFVRTTAFAKSLYEGLHDRNLIEWHDVKRLQQHWIGECTGMNIEFEVLSNIPEVPRNVSLWTDKPEFLESAQFVAVSPDSILGNSTRERLSEDTRSILLSVKARNPLTGQELPVYVTDVFDFKERDNYLGIPGSGEKDAEFCDSVGLSYKIVDALSEEDAQSKREETVARAKSMNVGVYPVSRKLRDWLISRQRYWGTPIPIVHCEKCGPCPVPSEELPVLLPKISRDEGEKLRTLREETSWLETRCPQCGGAATREPDTMDTFVDSSWYFMRYLDPKNNEAIFDKEKAMRGLPVDIYIGGKEHAVLHLYFARFISHFLHSEGLVPTSEPFKQLLVQGMVFGKTYREEEGGKYLKPTEVEEVAGKTVEKGTGNTVLESWEKMSKSKYNGVDPVEMFDKYGADTTRLIMLADFAPTSTRNWSDKTFPGILNWQRRLWLSIRNFLAFREEVHAKGPEAMVKPESEAFTEQSLYMYDSRNYYVKGVTFNVVKSQQLSVAISKMQGLTNSLRSTSRDTWTHCPEYERALAAQIIMLAPLAPQFASELWAGFCSAPYHLANDDPGIRRDLDVLDQNWPEIDMDYNMDLIVFVNRVRIFVKKFPRRDLEKMSEVEAVHMVTESEEFKNFIGDFPVLSVSFNSAPGFDSSINFRVHMSNQEMMAKKKKSVKNKYVK